MLVACRLAGLPRLRRIMRGSEWARNSGPLGVHSGGPFICPVAGLRRLGQGDEAQARDARVDRLPGGARRQPKARSLSIHESLDSTTHRWVLLPIAIFPSPCVW